MIRMLAMAAAGLVSLAVAAEPVEFSPSEYSTPDSADEVLEAADLPFRLHYAADRWELTPQRSNFRLLARAVHKEEPISGAFVFREQPASVEAVRQRARAELEEAFANHEIEGFSERLVNGMPVLYMKARATNARGTEVVVRNYYWVGADGVADYGLVARRALFEANSEAIMDLLNGLEITPAEGVD